MSMNQMNPQPVIQPEPTIAQAVVLRHPPLCFAWFAAMATGFGLPLILTGPLQLLSVFLGLYAAQGLLAELLGVRIDGESIVTPRRFVSASPLLVLWRERIPLATVERISSRRPSFGIEWASVRNGYNNDRTLLAFSSRDQKMSFFKIIKAFRPTLALYRSD